MYFQSRLWIFFFFLCQWVAIAEATFPPFKPWEYPKKTSECKAIRRAPVEEEVDIQLSASQIFISGYVGMTDLTIMSFLEYVDINPDAPTTMVMVHGWPGLWSIWSHQIQAFKVRSLLGFCFVCCRCWTRTTITLSYLKFGAMASQRTPETRGPREQCRIWLATSSAF